ncbi:MAG: DUF2817 domain-containing protein [Planctomycetes bacterium]|nr:DUF2817 domain-containing protein [Planctomycetota bacterium]
MLKTHMLATSAEGRPIHAYELENESPAILIVGGMHGDEPQSAFVADRIVELLQTRIGDMMHEHLIVVPQLNPDGLERGSRKNSREVDINRNFPTANWSQNEPDDAYYGGPSAGSEPETQLILELIRRHGPRRILTVHCIDGERQCVNFDGPAEALARAMAKENGYEVRSDIGHATPGSLGTWAGYERQIPTVTLELPADETDEKCWQDNRDAVMSFIQAAIE